MTDDSDSKKYLKSLLGFDSDDFFGTGLTFAEFSRSHDFRRWVNSLSHIRDRTETKRRLKLIRRLCAALEEVEREHGVFATVWVYDGLLAIYDGDWKECRHCAEMLLHEGEDARTIEVYGAAHAPLRAILLEACETALPSDEDARH
jgi:hypothetical protein